MKKLSFDIVFEADGSGTSYEEEIPNDWSDEQINQRMSDLLDERRDEALEETGNDDYRYFIFAVDGDVRWSM